MKSYGIAFGDELQSVGEADTTMIHYSLFIIHSHKENPSVRSADSSP